MTHALLLTAPTPAAIGVILLTGPDARRIVSSLSSAAGGAAMGSAVHAILRHQGQTLDESMVVCLSDGRFELHLHGGRAVIEGAFAALEALGAARHQEDLSASVLAYPDESAISREVLSALRSALTRTAVLLLANQRADGSGMEAFTRALLARVETTPLWQIQSALQWLLTRSAELQFLLTPPRVAIIGPPNAGKSTLANALLGRPLSITSDTPGTTRDWVDATAMFTAGDTQVAITLIDTAGIRETTDAIEHASIVRTRQQAAAADLIVAVVDASAPPADMAWLGKLCAGGARVILALNKCDLATVERPSRDWLANQPPANPERGVPVVAISALAHLRLDSLMRAALHQLGLASVSNTEIFCFTPRQRNLITAAALAPDAAAVGVHLRHLLEGSA